MVLKWKFFVLRLFVFLSFMMLGLEVAVVFLDEGEKIIPKFLGMIFCVLHQSFKHKNIGNTEPHTLEKDEKGKRYGNNSSHGRAKIGKFIYSLERVLWDDVGLMN